MISIFRGLDFVFVYLDDILVASPDHHAHANHFHQVFGRLQNAGLAINKEKSVLGETEVPFLGQLVIGSILTGWFLSQRRLTPSLPCLSLQRKLNYNDFWVV